MKVVQSFRHGDIHGYKFANLPPGAPKMFAHIYYLDGLLVDTGQSSMRQEILQQLGELSVETIFVSHHHEDHTGNLSALRELFGVPTYASPLCVEMMKDPPRISPAQWLIWGGYRPDHQLLPVAPYLETSQYWLEVVSIPGHSADMVGLYLESEGCFFSADIFVSEYIAYFKRDEDMGQQIISLKKVLQLDFDTLLCGHNPQLKGGKEKLKKKLQFLEDFYGRARDLQAKGLTARQVLKAMKLKERTILKWISLGELSTLNMVRSALDDKRGSDTK